MSTIKDLLHAYRTGAQNPSEVLRAARREAVQCETPVWITVVDEDYLSAQLDRLAHQNPSLPLYGIPFAVKDNIDVAGLPTTAGCPDSTYISQTSATAVRLLQDSGAVLIGKTNMDQFATGLVGTRSPYGALSSVFSEEHVAGGSSSGSAVAVARGQVAFSLGTDTAGSGRVPAAFNELLGLKPTRGRISTRGVVPACRTLDCVSVFTQSLDDLQVVYEVLDKFDEMDPYSRATPAEGAIGASSLYSLNSLKVGVWSKAQLRFFGDEAMQAAYFDFVTDLKRCSESVIEIDAALFIEAAALLYEGPWLAERSHAIGDFMEVSGASMLDITRGIIERGFGISAINTFDGIYRLAEITRHLAPIFSQVDLIMTPTAGRHPRLSDVEAEPFECNSQLGYYTNFMNLLDLSAIAFPGGHRRDGLPFGVTAYGPAHAEAKLLGAVRDFENAEGNLAVARVQPAPSGWVHVVVCGAHMTGGALNWQLTDRCGRFVVATETAPSYQFFALAGGPPERPGLFHVGPDRGKAIGVEVWALPISEFGSFVAGIPAPLGIGTVELADGTNTCGFICEPRGQDGAVNITPFGSWRSYMASVVRANDPERGDPSV